MDFETIETERLYLKKLTPEDFTRIFAERSENEVISLMGLSTHEEYLRDKAKSEGGYRTYDRTVVAFLLVSKETGETLGRAGFHNWYFDHRRAELGYALFREHERRKGYMGEAVKRIIRYGFEVMNLNRMEAYIGAENEASLAIIRANGFTYEGTLRQHYVVNDKAEDSLLFALLNKDYSLGSQN